MTVLRFSFIIALAYTANAGQDLELGYKLFDCLQKAMILGIPSMDYKTHQPLTISENLTWTLDIQLARATLILSNMTWHGIPEWKVTAIQLTEDYEPHVIFDYNIHWNKFLLTSLYEAGTDAKLNPPARRGNMNITMDNTDWSGRINFTKPGFNLTVQVNNLTVYWTAEEVDFNFTGLGVIEKSLSSTLGIIFKRFLNSGALGNKLGEFFHHRLNTKYFQHIETIDEILEFCRTTPYPDDLKWKS